MKAFANASAAAPPAVYFAKAFIDYPALRFIAKSHAFGLEGKYHCIVSPKLELEPGISRNDEG